VATETAKFALELEDGISSSAESAQDALQLLQSQIERDSKALRNMKKAMKDMQAGSSMDVSAYHKLQAEIDATQHSIAEARASFVNLGGDFSKLGQKAKKTKLGPSIEIKGLSEMLGATGALPGPLGKLSGALGHTSSMVTGLTGAMSAATVVAVGLVAVFVVLAAALVALAAATAQATAKLVQYSVAQADALRSERLRLQGLGLTRFWYRMTAQDASDMSDAIGRVASRVPAARIAVASLGAEVHQLGLRGQAAEQALESLSLAQAVGGERGLAQMRMLVRGLRFTRDGMSRLAEFTRRTYGDVAAKQLLSLAMLSTKPKDSIEEMFSGLNVEPLLAGLYRLTQLFSQNTDSGRALKSIMEAMVGPFVEELTGAIPAIERFFLTLVLFGLDVAIVFVRARNAIRRTFGSGLLGALLSSEGAMHLFQVALVAVGLIAGGLVATFALLGFMVMGLLTPLMLVAAAIHRAYRAFMQFTAHVARAAKLFGKEGWKASGASIVDGIVHGLRDGWTRLQAKVRDMATAALGTFREVLGIRSPSRIFAQVGLAIPQGVAQGIAQGAPAAQDAASAMVTSATTDIRTTTTVTADVRAGGQGSTSRAITTGEIHIHVGSGKDAEETAERVRDALHELFTTNLALEGA
jgi:hypothetical protein